MTRTTRTPSSPPVVQTALCLASLLACWPAYGEWLARPHHPPLHSASSLPAADAAVLGALAPSARLSTLRGTYGDASFSSGRSRRGADAATRLAPRFACARRAEGTFSGGCEVGAPVRVRALVERSYTFAPAYVSSPLVDAGGRAPLLPAATAFLWAVDGLGDVPAR